MSASARLLARVFVCVCVCVCMFVAKNTTEDYLFRAARIFSLTHIVPFFILLKNAEESSLEAETFCCTSKLLENDSQIANCGVVIWNIE